MSSRPNTRNTRNYYNSWENSKKILKITRGGAFERLGVLVSGKVFLQWKKIFLMVL